jgi:hypothetical protein
VGPAWAQDLARGVNNAKTGDMFPGYNIEVDPWYSKPNLPPPPSKPEIPTGGPFLGITITESGLKLVEIEV